MKSTSKYDVSGNRLHAHQRNYTARHFRKVPSSRESTFYGRAGISSPRDRDLNHLPEFDRLAAKGRGLILPLARGG
jgi:hypothetical protein